MPAPEPLDALFVDGIEMGIHAYLSEPAADSSTFRKPREGEAAI